MNRNAQGTAVEDLTKGGAGREWTTEPARHCADPPGKVVCALFASGRERKLGHWSKCESGRLSPVLVFRAQLAMVLLRVFRHFSPEDRIV